MIILKNVHYIPSLDESIISVHQFNKENRSSVILNANNGFLFLCRRRVKERIATIYVYNDLYYLNVSIKYNDLQNQTVVNSTVRDSENVVISRLKRKKNKLSDSQKQLRTLEGDLWHKRMGHISSSYVNRLKHVSQGMNEFIYADKQCEVCIKSKLVRKKFDKDRDRASRPCEIIHLDLMGAITPVTFVDKNQ